MSRGADARRCLASCRAGVLSTLSQRHAGHPFGSLVTVATDLDGSPLILTSRLSTHTANLEADVIESPDTVSFRIGTSLDDAEKQLILRTLSAHGNNKTRTAEILGISLKTLHNKLKSYGA